MADVVTVDFQKKQQGRWIVLCVGVAVLGLGAGLGVRFYQTHHTKPAVAAKKTHADTAQDLSLMGDYDAAQKQLQQALAQPGLTSAQKYSLYYQQGSTYQGEGNNQAALDSYKKAAALKKTQNLYESMAALAVQMGDKAAAIDYYNQAIKLIPTSSPISEDSKQADEAAIKALQEQQ